MTVKVQAELTAKDNLSPKLGGVQAALERFKIGVEENSRGIKKLENSFENFGVAATGLQGNVGRVADALIEFAPGGMVGVAAIAGISAIILYFQNLSAEGEKAAKATEEIQLRILRLKGLNVQADMQVAEAANRTYTESQKQLQKLESQIKDLQDALANPVPGAEEQGGTAAALFTLQRQADTQRKIVEQNRVAAQEAGIILQRQAEADNKARQDRIAKAQSEQERLLAIQKKADDEREKLLNYSNEIRIRSEENLYKTIEGIKKDGEEQAKLRVIRQKEFEQNLGLPTSDELTKRIEEQFAPGGIGLKSIEQVIKDITILTNSMPDTFGKAFESITNDFITANSKAMDLNSTLGGIAGITLVGLQDGFAKTFEAIGAGEATLGSLGKAAQKAVAAAAAAEGRLAFGRGLVEIAKAIKGDPTAAMSAAKYFAAGAFLTTLAGALGKSASTGGAGGGGGGVGGSTGVNSSRLGSSEVNQGTITINIAGGSILDMSNIDTQRSFIRAIEAVTNKRAILIGA